LCRTSDFEVGVKHFKAGEIEVAHKQIVATEISVVISGVIEMNGQEFQEGQIITVLPGEITNFRSLTNSSLVCVKFPSIPADRIIV